MKGKKINFQTLFNIFVVITISVLLYFHFRKKESFEGIAGSSFVSRVPKGTIVAYYPPKDDWEKNPIPVPAGWIVCDGKDGKTPDLRGKFIWGYNPKENQDTSRWFNTFGGPGGDEQHILSLEEIPPHNHSVGGLAKWGTSCGDNCANIDSGSKFGAVSGNTNLTGGKDGTTQPHNNLPPFYVLVYIMKL